MAVTNVQQNADELTFTITSEFNASIERVWQVLEDPRKLEKWWGPPEYPATVVEHSLTPEGRVSYFMTGPDGEKYYGYWEVQKVDAPHLLEFRDGFADESGKPNNEMPTTTARVSLESIGESQTRMEITSQFESSQDMAQLIEMGMEEGMKQALSQIDAVI